MTRLSLCYIRDHACYCILSYVDAVFNLADLGTKLKGNLKIWLRFIRSGEFQVSFLGRTKSKKIFDQQEQSSASMQETSAVAAVFDEILSAEGSIEDNGDAEDRRA